jgi:hypothetical protein
MKSVEWRAAEWTPINVTVSLAVRWITAFPELSSLMRRVRAAQFANP